MSSRLRRAQGAQRVRDVRPVGRSAQQQHGDTSCRDRGLDGRVQLTLFTTSAAAPADPAAPSTPAKSARRGSRPWAEKDLIGQLGATELGIPERHADERARPP